MCGDSLVDEEIPVIFGIESVEDTIRNEDRVSFVQLMKPELESPLDFLCL
mgnify:CR=1 FL=1